MGSREKDDESGRHHHPVLSSLVIRPAESGGGGSDYEPGEVRRDPPPYSRIRAADSSVSPVRRHRFSPPGFLEPPRSRVFGNGKKEPGRYRRDYSPPPYGHGRFPPGRGRGRGPGPFRVEGFPRSNNNISNNNPNVRPRDGDWICLDPLCKNLNFARREYCNNCDRPRYRRGYPRVPPLDLMNGGGGGGYRSRSPPPPRGWPPAGPPSTTRHEVRYPPPDRQEYPDTGNRYRSDRGRDNNYFNERRGFGRRPDLSPPPAPVVPPPRPRGWASSGSHFRDRSRSPVRVGSQPYLNRVRDYRPGGVGRDGF